MIPGLNAEASEEAKTAENAWQAAAEGGKQGLQTGAMTGNPYAAAAGLVVGAAKGAMQHGAESNKRRVAQHRERYAPKTMEYSPDRDGKATARTMEYRPGEDDKARHEMLDSMGDGNMFSDAVKGILQGNQGGGDKNAGGLFAQLKQGMGAASGG